ncbi:MAG: FecR family protein, partial [Candidatus Neomarinimicrobiota bacterium]|nr:FecR family protein [Candidatus Neomarinimicrobiota bacterium]
FNNKPLVIPRAINWQPRFIYAFLLAFLLLMPTTIRYLNTKKVVSEFGVTDKNIILSDGTNIQLNAGSILSYSKDYNIKNRKVFLDGEAYFDVTKSQFPFIVSTDYAQVTVLGTQFNVRSRSDGFETGVNEGSVEVKKDNESKVLVKGQRVLIHSKSQSTIESSPTNDYYPGWLNNKIVCDNTSLETICKEIERTYNIKILFKDISQKKISISGIINLYPNNLKSVVSSISLLSQREFKLKGDTYTVL